LKGKGRDLREKDIGDRRRMNIREGKVGRRR
jgi:hypothetical protein